MLTLWGLCRSPEGGYLRMPDEGGVNDQAAFVMSAFNALDHVMSDYQDWKKSARDG
jgi:hypothetical protein